MITPVKIMFALFNLINKFGKFKHNYVDWLYSTYNCLSEPKYKFICVYIFYNQTTKEFYIGSGDEQRRERHHIRLLEAGRLNKLNKNGATIHHHSWKFQRAYNRNQKFEFHYVSMKNKKEALAFEQLLLDIYHNDEFNVNTSKYVELGTLGLNDSNETKEKKRQARLNYIKNNPDFTKQYSEIFSGKNNPMFGKNHSDKTKQTQSEVKKSYFKNLSDEARVNWSKNLSVSKLGNRNSLGYKHPPEFGKLISNCLYKPLMINGVRYSSRLQAAKETKISPVTITRRIYSDLPKWAEWYYL